MARVALPRTTARSTANGPSLIGRAAGRALLYLLLIALSALILLPLSWMVTAALKPSTAPVFTYPPEWFPTTHWQTFRDALTNPDQPFRDTHSTAPSP
ncbi:MAG: hypothetical protein WKH64_08155 [Chloroflexia bacterium]